MNDLEEATARIVAGDPSRFGVFLPSYVWEGDGPERVHGIQDFARRVEDPRPEVDNGIG